MILRKINPVVKGKDISVKFPENTKISAITDELAKIISLENLEIKSFYIGDVKILNPVISAPMAGISDNTYRIFAKIFGASLVFSEMITSCGLIHKHEKSFELSKISRFERPCAVQLFGSNPDIIAEAAKLIEGNADIIDINMGCPVPKVLKTGSGGALLQDPLLIGKIIKKIKNSIKIPVTVKLRLGWDLSDINIVKTSQIAQDEGADAISIHGRTVKQNYSGTADYEYIKKVIKLIKIPVIVSGDLNNASKALFVYESTGCQGLMIGRAARGNPQLFSDILNVIFKKYNQTENENKFEINFKKNDLMIQYLKLLIEFKGEERACKEFRKILGWAFKGRRDISETRKKFFEINNFEESKKILNEMQ